MNYNMINEATQNLLEGLGEDVNREGLRGTPDRVARMWAELCAGYNQDPGEILHTDFEEGACDQMVALTNIKGWSTCEHHLLPFSYTAHVAYIPNGRVVGISKLARLVECFGRRLQIQERMTDSIADAIMGHLQARGAMVVIEGQHLCMRARGVKQEHAFMQTSAIRGEFQDAATRNEFFSLIRK